MQDLANAFVEDEIRRAVMKCESLNELRQLTLRTLDLLKMQRQVFDDLIRWAPGQIITRP